MLIKKLNSLLTRLFLLNYHLFRHERTSLTFYFVSLFLSKLSLPVSISFHAPGKQCNSAVSPVWPNPSRASRGACLLCCSGIIRVVDFRTVSYCRIICDWWLQSVWKCNIQILTLEFFLHLGIHNDNLLKTFVLPLALPIYLTYIILVNDNTTLT